MTHVATNADTSRFAVDQAPIGPLRGKRAAMVVFSTYPFDPRPRRAAEALTAEGMSVDYICLEHEGALRQESVGGVEITRVPIDHRRGGKVSYVSRYGAFTAIVAWMLARRSLKRRYDLVYVNNMPDALVACALVPKMLGAKVILDLHDPMPELMTTIFGLGGDSALVRVIRRLERWSIAIADQAVTVNEACRRIFTSRSCAADKISLIMNAPNERAFPFQPVGSAADRGRAAGGPVVVYHGSLVERNGVDLAVDAVARVRDRFPDIELRIFGRATPFSRQVMNDVQQRGLTRWVRYLGPKTETELGAAIQGCDIGIIPNRLNPFTEINTPTRLFEYLALGKPVIAPDTGGIRDYFDSDSLLFFRAGDSESLSEQLAAALSDRERTLRTVARGQAVYLDHTWSQERSRLVSLVQRLVEKKRA